MDTKRKIKYLVADTTAFINAVQLNEYAEKVLTVPDVIKEVRNKRQIRRICVLPFDLQVREPRPESVKYCVEFAKKTGDYASLSGIDIKVIALTYELEVDHMGSEHLRCEPVLSKVIASKEKPQELKDNTKLAGWYNPKGNEDSEDDDYEEDSAGASDDYSEHNNNDEESEVDCVKEKIEAQLVEPGNKDATADITEEELNDFFQKLRCETNESVIPYEDLLVTVSKTDDGKNEESTDDESGNGEINIRKTDKLPSSDNCKDDECGDHDGGWITPSNIKKVKKSLEGKTDADVIPTVGCMSTDYALQNVLKQINLQICALDGRIIKHLRTYILRCYSCFKTTSIMTKVFCPNCGNKTLKRVAVSLDEDGKQVIHINTSRPLTSKYKNQSLPRFRGGKHSRNPILFEDQPIPRQMPSRVAKTKTNAMDEDYIAGFSPFVMRDLDSKSAMLRSKGNLKEWARNNTFEEDRRKKHYNRLYK